MSKDNPHIDLYLDGADPEAIRFDGLDYAVIGIDQNGLLVYSYDNVLGTMAGRGFTVLYTEEVL
jgi:hypothetical protein